MNTLIQPTDDPDPKTLHHYRRPDGSWVQATIVEGGGRISVGDNHELVTALSPDEVAEQRGWTQPHL